MRRNVKGTFNGATFKRFALSAVLPALLTLGGCGGSVDGGHDESKQMPPAADQEQNAFAPRLYCVLNDKSASVKSARMAPLTEGDLVALIEILRRTGGALAYGEIGESKDRPLVRLHVTAPPAPPQKPDSQNAFERSEQEGRYEEQSATHKAEYEKWEAEVNRKAEAFLEEVRPRLRSPAHDRATDLNAALSRADLFLGEPAWPESAHPYVILNSDGVNTVRHSPPFKFRSRARIVLVNGTGSVGNVLGPLDPLRFESLQSALQFIADTEVGRKK